MDLRNLRDTPPWDWPEDTDIALLAILQNPAAEPSDRLLATELAGDYTVMNDEIARVLLAMAGDRRHSEELRSRAAISLGPALESANSDGFDDPDDIPISEEAFKEIQKGLRTIFVNSNTPKGVRRRILEASVRAPEAWHEDAIRKAYDSGDDEWKLSAIFAMHHVRGFDQEILDCLNDANPNIRLEAIRAAGQWGIDEAWPHISKLIKSPKSDKSLRLVAIEAAPYIRPKETLEVVMDVLDSHDEDIAEAAQEAMSIAEGNLTSTESDADEDEDLD